MSKLITLFDPSVCSTNTADSYLTAVCQSIMTNNFTDCFFTKVSTHNEIDTFAKQRLENSYLGVVCGSGILSQSYYGKTPPAQWKILKDEELPLPVTGLGIGFDEQKTDFDERSKHLYQNVFKDVMVGARGYFSTNLLLKIGINAVDIGCPTLWKIPHEPNKPKCENVIFSVNLYRDYDYNKIYSMLEKFYNNVYLYCQHPGDYDYFRANVKCDDIKLAPSSSLSQLYEFARSNNCDYVGARLHAAAFLMAYGIRCYLIPVDIRGQEVWAERGFATIRSSTTEECFAHYLTSNYYNKKYKIGYEEVMLTKSNFDASILPQMKEIIYGK